MNDLLQSLAQQIIISKSSHINIEKLQTLSYSLLTKLSIVLRSHTSYQVEQFAYIIPINERIQLLPEQITLVPQQVYYSQTICSLECSNKAIIVVLKDQLINNLLSQYYRLAEEGTLHHLMGVYFLNKMSYGFFSSLLHQCKKQEFVRKAKVYSVGDPADCFFVLLEGEIQLKVLVEPGPSQFDFESAPSKNQVWAQFARKGTQKKQDLIIKIVCSGQCFGEVDIFHEEPYRSQNAECSSLSCQVLHVPRDILLKELRTFTRNPHLELKAFSHRNTKHVDLIHRHSILRQKKSLQVRKDYSVSTLSQSKEQPQGRLKRSQSQLEMKNSLYVHPNFVKPLGKKGSLTVQEYIKAMVGKALRNKGVLSPPIENRRSKAMGTTNQMKLLDQARRMTPIGMIRQRQQRSLHES